MSQSL